MKLVRFLALPVALCLVALPAANAAMDDNKPITITTTGAGAKGFVKAIVEAYHGIFRDAYPGTAATFRPSGVAGGLVAVATGKADITTTIPPVELQRAMAGEAPFEQSIKGKVLHILTLMDNIDMYFIANKAWAKKNGITSIADIGKNKPKMTLAINRKGVIYSNAVAEEMFKEHGFTLQDVVKWGGHITYNASNPTLKDLRDGKVDVMIQGGFHPDGRIVDLDKSRPLIWLTGDRDSMERVAKRLDMKVVPFSKSNYAFLDRDIFTIRATIAMGAGVHVADETVYKIVKAMAEHTDRMQAIHPSFRDFSLQRMIKKSDLIGFHPGARKYYREKGLVN